jgi:hypothetical protein
MKKVIRLTESGLISLIKKVIAESTTAQEPVLSKGGFTGGFYFGEGQTKLAPSESQKAINDIKMFIKSSIPTIQKFHNSPDFKLPQFATFYVGTSSTGGFAVNKQVAQGRMNYLTDLFLKAMASYGIREDVAYKLITQSNKDYQPSKIDRDFYDPSKIKPKQSERNGYIVIRPIETIGMTQDQIGQTGGGLIDASSWLNTFFVDNVDEDMILDNMRKIKTYSDITDLDTFLLNSRRGNLESFLNNQLFDDPKIKSSIVSILNAAARKSGKDNIAKIASNGDIAIIGSDDYGNSILEAKNIRQRRPNF